MQRLERGGAVRNVLESGNSLTYRIQRLLAGRDQLAKEFTEADIRQPQRPNGITAPDDEAYKALLGNDFSNWRLEVGGGELALGTWQALRQRHPRTGLWPVVLGADPAWQMGRTTLTHADTGAVTPQPARVLVRPTTAWETLAAAVLAPLLGGGSSVVVEGPVDDDALARLAAAERVGGAMA